MKNLKICHRQRTDNSGRHHFSETFIESFFCRKKKIAESHLTESSHGRIVELAKLHNAERHFSESLFNRTSFLQIVVQPNVIFTNRRSAERRFPVTSFARTSFYRIVLLLKCNFAETLFCRKKNCRKSFDRIVKCSNC